MIGPALSSSRAASAPDFDCRYTSLLLSVLPSTTSLTRHFVSIKAAATNEPFRIVLPTAMACTLFRALATGCVACPDIAIASRLQEAFER